MFKWKQGESGARAGDPEMKATAEDATVIIVGCNRAAQMCVRLIHHLILKGRTRTRAAPARRALLNLLYSILLRNMKKMLLET